VLRFSLNPRGATCFVEFDSVEAASASHAALQGTALESNDRGPVRLQFAKAPTNRKRDASGVSVGGGGAVGLTGLPAVIALGGILEGGGGSGGAL
jgi:hypothetical protein